MVLTIISGLLFRLKMTVKKEWQCQPGLLCRNLLNCLEDINQILSLFLAIGLKYLLQSLQHHIIGISVAHIAGGDVTEGAVDDAILHCITKDESASFSGV